jgi:hypothetical protein
MAAGYERNGDTFVAESTALYAGGKVRNSILQTYVNCIRPKQLYIKCFSKAKAKRGAVLAPLIIENMVINTSAASPSYFSEPQCLSP